MKTFCLFIGYGLAAALFLAAYAAMFASLRGLPRYTLPRARAQAVPGSSPAAATKPAGRRLVEPAFYKSRPRPRQPALLLATQALGQLQHES